MLMLKNEFKELQVVAKEKQNIYNNLDVENKDLKKCLEQLKEKQKGLFV